MSKVAVVILNWNTRVLLERFLPTLANSLEGQDVELIVADNASEDDSVPFLRDNWPDVGLIALDKNYGFTGGYNRALAQVEADYYVLINSDVEVSDRWLQPLVSWMDSHPQCAVCGPKLHALKDRDSFEYAGAAGGLIDRWGFPFCRGRVMGRLEKDCGQYDDMKSSVLWVSGACMMVRSSVWRELGGLDENFFAHMEEIDFCWRAQLAGYDVDIVSRSMVWHLGGGTLPQGSPRKLKLNYRNNLLMLSKNLAGTYMCAGMEPARARRKAGRKLRLRMIIDRLTAIAYVLEFHIKDFRAVREAHREFMSIRKNMPSAPAPVRTLPVSGIYRGSMILASVLHQGKVFSYLRNKGV